MQQQVQCRYAAAAARQSAVAVLVSLQCPAGQQSVVSGSNQHCCWQVAAVAAGGRGCAVPPWTVAPPMHGGVDQLLQMQGFHYAAGGIRVGFRSRSIEWNRWVVVCLMTAAGPGERDLAAAVWMHQLTAQPVPRLSCGCAWVMATGAGMPGRGIGPLGMACLPSSVRLHSTGREVLFGGWCSPAQWVGRGGLHIVKW